MLKVILFIVLIFGSLGLMLQAVKFVVLSGLAALFVVAVCAAGLGLFLFFERTKLKPNCDEKSPL